MSSLFSSPSKQAQQAAQVSEQAAQTEIGSPGPVTVPNADGSSTTISPTGSGVEGYVQQGEEAEQAAIAGLGENPYLAAAGSMNPGGYAVNPSSTVTYGAPTPPGGLTPTPAQPTVSPAAANAFAPTSNSTTRYAQPVARQTPAPGTAATTSVAQAPPGTAPATGPLIVGGLTTNNGGQAAGWQPGQSGNQN